MVVRARRVQGKGDDSVVKLRPVVPGDAARDSCAARRASASRSTRCPAASSARRTLKGALRPTDVRAALAGELADPQAVLQGAARVLHRARAGRASGSTTSRSSARSSCSSCAWTPAELERRLVAEMWLYPDGSRVLELSTRCGTDEAFQVAAEMRAYLTAAASTSSGEQQTKTRKALEYFAERRA